MSKASSKDILTPHDQTLWLALARRLQGMEYFDRLQELAGDALDP